jgi:hypothetical protein
MTAERKRGDGNGNGKGETEERSFGHKRASG